MEMKQVNENCFGVLNEKNRMCEANSDLIYRAGSVVVDTHSDLAQGGKATFNAVPGRSSTTSVWDSRSVTRLTTTWGLTFSYKSTIIDGAPDALCMN
jgi:hypothetical protein